MTTKTRARLETEAAALAALGHPMRLAILRCLVQGPAEGTPAGACQEQVGIPASTLSHHLATLSEAGLIAAERRGTFLHYRVQFQRLRELTDYLWKDCCGGGSTCC